MARQIWRAGIFMIMMLFFMITAGTYDPVSYIGDVHGTLKSRFRAADLPYVTTKTQLYDYIQQFIETTYEHSAVLTDANTLDAIDPNSCFSERVSALCRLQYWNNDWNSSAPRQIIKMTPDRAYPYVSLVPLAPMVMQTRCEREVCAGFGDMYNTKLNGSSINSPLGDVVDPFDPYSQYYVKYGVNALDCVDR